MVRNTTVRWVSVGPYYDLKLYSGKITISGGYASESGLTDTIEQYDIEAGNWSVYARLKEPTFWHGSVSVHKFINPPNSPDFKCESNAWYSIVLYQYHTDIVLTLYYLPF